MKTIIITSAALLVSSLALAAKPSDTIPPRGDDAERKSKNGRLEAEVGGASVIVSYGRPEVRKRKVWGGLVQYGKLWRTGADEATTLTFDAPVRVQGERVEPGTYALFTVPGADEWTVILNRQAKQWGAYKHDPEQDVLRVKTKPRSGEHAEALTFEATDSELVLRWAKLAVPITIRAL
jgi:hypothetical protein